MGGLKGIEIFPGARNQNLISFTRYISSDPLAGDPDNEFEARNYMLGMKKLGGIFDPCGINYWGGIFGGIDCSTINPLYWYSGDPETQVGWLNTRGSDYRILVNTGPFDLYENDPVTIIVAYTIGRGNSPENSVTVAKLNRNLCSSFTNLIFNYNLVSVEDEIANIPLEFILHQNYPNPFNPSTTISWQLPVSCHHTLKAYDVIGNEVATLFNEFRNAGSYEVDFNASALSSGVYFYKLQAGLFVQTKK